MSVTGTLSLTTPSVEWKSATEIQDNLPCSYIHTDILSHSYALYGSLRHQCINVCKWVNLASVVKNSSRLEKSYRNASPSSYKEIQKHSNKVFTSFQYTQVASTVIRYQRLKCGGTEDSQHEHVADKPAATHKNIGHRIYKLNL